MELCQSIANLVGSVVISLHNDLTDFFSRDASTRHHASYPMQQIIRLADTHSSLCQTDMSISMTTSSLNKSTTSIGTNCSCDGAVDDAGLQSSCSSRRPIIVS